MDEEKKKIELPETVLLLLYIVPLDVVGIILLLFGLDDFFVFDVLTFPVTQFYFRMKGVKATYDLIAGGLELIPYVGSLPIKTAGVLMTIWAANHPKATAPIARLSRAATGKISAAAE
jgi:hypothetical protein